MRISEVSIVSIASIVSYSAVSRAVAVWVAGAAFSEAAGNGVVWATECAVAALGPNNEVVVDPNIEPVVGPNNEPVVELEVRAP